MECPKCKTKLDHVHVFSQCWQKAQVDEKGNVSDYGSVEEVLETLAIECPECSEDITNLCTEP